MEVKPPWGIGCGNRFYDYGENFGRDSAFSVRGRGLPCNRTYSISPLKPD